MQQKVTLQIQYFKKSGKFYEEESLEISCEISDNNFVSMIDISALVKDWRLARQLPGLASGYWDSFIYLDVPDFGYPILILPES